MEKKENNRAQNSSSGAQSPKVYVTFSLIMPQLCILFCIVVHTSYKTITN